MRRCEVGGGGRGGGARGGEGVAAGFEGRLEGLKTPVERGETLLLRRECRPKRVQFGALGGDERGKRDAGRFGEGIGDLVGKGVRGRLGIVYAGGEVGEAVEGVVRCSSLE